TDEKLTNQRLGEVFRHEGAKVVDVFAHADEEERDWPLLGILGSRMRDGADHAALRRAVELGQDEAGQAERLVERLDLRERVLPGVGVEDEQHLMRRAVEGLARDALDLADLLHEVQLRWK